ncbi:MAG: glycosyltransferase family 92 protein [Hyphomicrobiales bacterium]
MIAAIFRDEAPYLREWIEFHQLVGVKHFALYDNGSVDESHAVLAPYVQRGIVSVIPWNSFAAGQNAQRLAYAHALTNFGNRCAWMAFIDIDEFLFTENPVQLSEQMRAYEDVDVVHVGRYEFGPSGHAVQPRGLVLENYTERGHLTDVPKVKSIVRPCCATAVGTHRTLVRGGPARTREEARPLRINHYFTKSEAEFRAKLTRGWPEGACHDLELKWKLHAHIVGPVVRDETVLPLAAELAIRMGLRQNPTSVAA